MKGCNVLDYVHGIYIICVQTVLKGISVTRMGPEA